MQHHILVLELPQKIKLNRDQNLEKLPQNLINSVAQKNYRNSDHMVPPKPKKKMQQNRSDRKIVNK